MMGILLKGQPDNVQALYLRGKSYFYMDDQSMAKRHFGEALKYDPEHKEAKAEFTKVRSLYKKKAQVSQPHALLGRLHQFHADLLIQMGTVYLLTAADTSLLGHLKVNEYKHGSTAKCCNHVLSSLQPAVATIIIITIKTLSSS